MFLQFWRLPIGVSKNHFRFRSSIKRKTRVTINKARGVLAFIKRWAKEFKNPLITKQLYTSLVRPILEFGSVIWDPSSNICSAKIESVQKQFLLFCLRGSYPDFVNLPSYSTRLSQINLPLIYLLKAGEQCSTFHF
mgnify:CR=1 FL=1